MTETTIRIPYKPRYKGVHSALRKARFSVLVAHRRFGKTVLAVNHVIALALSCTKERGSFAYVAPYRNQAKTIAWDYLKHYTSTVPGRSVNESDLSIGFPNGSRIRIFGADNADALRGLYFDYVVLDEVAQMRPEVWQEIVRPALADRHGGALFIGTPKGANVFSEMYTTACSEQAKGNADWVAFSFPVTQTSALAPEEVDALRAELSDNAFRQEMLCDFNASSDDVLISLTLVSEAMNRNPREHEFQGAPLILGVDVARFGDDSSVLFFRRGIMAEKPIILRKLDNMELADRIAAECTTRKPAAVFIDAGGGAGVIDRLRQLGFPVSEVPFGSKPCRSNRFLNRRMEMWQGMADWIKAGGALPPDEILKAELCAPTYFFNPAGLLCLEKKEDIKERLLRSPDRADALALTFAAPVSNNIQFDARPAQRKPYDPLAW